MDQLKEVKKYKQASQQYTFMALLYYQKDNDTLPLAIDVIKILKQQEDLSSMAFLRDFKEKIEKWLEQKFIELKDDIILHKNKREAAVNQLKQLGLINKPDKKEGIIPLGYAIENNLFKVVKYLIQNGVNVNQANKEEGTTPLLAAIYKGYTKVVKVLIQNRADVKSS